MSESLLHGFDTHERWMREALKQAREAAAAGEVPVGALVVRDGEVLGRGHNRVEALHDATAHAEILALGAASERLGQWRLEGVTLYVTLEPCTMCSGAILLGRVDRLVFGAPDPRAGAVVSTARLLQGNPYRHPVEVVGGMLAGVRRPVARRSSGEPTRNRTQRVDLLQGRCYIARPIRRRGARVAESARLEIVCAERFRGFESLPLRQIDPGPHEGLAKDLGGEVPERLNGAVSKTVELARVPRVRIPASPPEYDAAAPIGRLRRPGSVVGYNSIKVGM